MADFRRKAPIMSRKRKINVRLALVKAGRRWNIKDLTNK